MGLKESIENHPVIWWLATLGVGFGAGLAAYHAALDISDSAVVSKGRLAALESQALEPNGRGPSPVSEGDASRSGSRDAEAQESAASEPPVRERGDEASSAGRSTNVPPPGALPSDATPPDATVRNGMELVSSRCRVPETCGPDCWNCVWCDVVVKAQGERDRDLSIGRNTTYKSRVLGPTGLEYPPKRMGFGQELSGLIVIDNVFPAGVPTAVRMEVCEVPEEIGAFTMVELALRGPEMSDRPFRLRALDVPIQR